MEKQQRNKALNYAYFYLKFRPRSRRELIDYLTKKAGRLDWDEAIITDAIIDLESQGLIDDKKFIEWFVNQRSAQRPKGVNLLKQQLMRFGVPKDLIDNFFLDNEIDEAAPAQKLLAKRWSRLVQLDKRERFKKAAMYLSGRGFGWSTIKKVIDIFEKG